MKLVVVESPAKAKTINKYLGSNYKVEASYGHVCDLPSKNGSVLPEENFAMKYEVSERSESHINKLCEIAKKSDELILATDPDREGESISWHVVNVLKERGAIDDTTKISRVAFNEITKKSILDSIKNPREIDQHLVDAQQARRALDYLVGFNLSPVLWRKLPGAKSAGRVQSVALRLICDREAEIEKFTTREYWDIFGTISEKSKSFSAKLIEFENQKLEKFSITSEPDALRIQKTLEEVTKWHVKQIEKKRQKRQPAPPFTTSTMQQEASRKLGFSTKKTMQLAQKLYEGIDLGSETVGLITYMRTDGVYIAQEAVTSIRDHTNKSFGPPYLPEEARHFKAKSKNAQEAHEAIRPTNIDLTSESLSKILKSDELKLYELIWKRTLASQMSNAELETVSVEITSDTNEHTLRASGSIIVFDGFYKLYKEGADDEEEKEENKILPPLKENQPINVKAIIPKQHFTEPPPRYNEASLVKRLEELGIGRPSTYASILSVIQDRAYVTLEKKRFIPEERGRLVTTFLSHFFAKYVEYDFTANLEEELDKVASGDAKWKDVLSDFWNGFDENVKSASSLQITEVINALDELLEDHLFPQKEDGNRRKCPACENGRLGLRVGKFGAFISCSNYPECAHKTNIQSSKDEGGENMDGLKLEDSDKLLGNHLGKDLMLKKGPYGFYVELKEEEKGIKPKRASLPPFIKPQDLDLNMAINLISLPKLLGLNADGNEISIGIGKYGPYIKCGNKFTAMPKSEDPFTINLIRSLEIIEEHAKLGKKKPK
ncbi:MAG: type I DNA topoisomerase [Alphaproteobacteria bacterium]|nr:type I DNA topoisomerase [Alphaproteobacteria bacterium]